MAVHVSDNIGDGNELENEMMVYVWDEVSGEWSAYVVERSTDPEVINAAIGALVGDEDEWQVEAHSMTGPVLTVTARSSRNHLCIMVVNTEN